MDVFKVYAMTKRKDGVITKSEWFITKEPDKESAIEKAKVYAKQFGFKGTIHIGSVYKKQPDKTFQKI